MTPGSLRSNFTYQLRALLHQRLDHVVMTIFGCYLKSSLLVFVEVHVSIFEDLLVQKVTNDYVIAILSSDVKEIDI